MVLYPAAFSSSSHRLPHTPLTPPVITHTTCHHTICHDDNLLTHNSTHTQLAHIQLNSHNLLTHNSTHTQLAHISHIQLVIIQLAHTHNSTHTQLAHTHLVLPDIHLRDRRGTWRHPPSFHVAGVALGHIHIRFTWQAWHLRHWAGSGGAPGSQLTPWTPRLSALCVAGVALGDIHLHFAWQARRGTWQHPPSFHVAGVALAW